MHNNPARSHETHKSPKPSQNAPLQCRQSRRIDRCTSQSLDPIPIPNAYQRSRRNKRKHRCISQILDPKPIPNASQRSGQSEKMDRRTSQSLDPIPIPNASQQSGQIEIKDRRTSQTLDPIPSPNASLRSGQSERKDRRTSQILDTNPSPNVSQRTIQSEIKDRRTRRNLGPNPSPNASQRTNQSERKDIHTSQNLGPNPSPNASQRTNQSERKDRRTSQNLEPPSNQNLTGWASIARKNTPRPLPIDGVSGQVSQTSQRRENHHERGSLVKRRDSRSPSVVRQNPIVTIVKEDSHWSLTRKGKIAKYGLFCFNVLFMLTGAAILALGAWMKLGKNVASFQTAIHVDKINKIYIEIAAYVLIGFGILVMSIAFFGCCGACTESSFLLTVYVILLLVVYGGEVTICALGYLFKNKIMSTVKPKLALNFQNSKYEPNNKYAKAWDVVQVAKFVPTSCCAAKIKDGRPTPNDTVKCQKEADPLIKPIKYEYLNHKGCFDTVMKWIYENTAIVRVVLGAIVLIELMGIILACCVCFSRRRKPSTRTIHRQLL